MCNTTTIGGDLFIEFLHVFFFILSGSESNFAGKGSDDRTTLVCSAIGLDSLTVGCIYQSEESFRI
jgi:hypothetical protein